jgi:RimJ/RimL family protein N-acetyltransferase
MHGLQLRPFRREDLSQVEPWFQDADTQRWLGGPGWPRQMLDLSTRPLGEFRGMTETGRYRWLAWEEARAVGYIDCGTYDRWAVWEGGPEGRGVVETVPVPAAAIAYVVDPALRGRGYCAAMVRALIGMPRLRGVRLFAAGVEPANADSIGCLRAAGFQPLKPVPDWEGIVYYGRFTAEPPVPPSSL